MFRQLCLLSLMVVLTSCTRIDERFTESFVEANYRMDDGAWAAAYSPEMRVLAIGRESGRLELWDALKASARISRQAHELRVQGIAFGPEDGIVITNSASGNVRFGDIVQIENGPKVWDAHTGELLHAFREDDWLPGAVSATPVPGIYLLASDGELRIYEHARRSLVGTPLSLAEDGGITSIDWDKASGLIVAGTDKGAIHLLKMHHDKRITRLDVVGRHALDAFGPRNKILTVMLLDEGRKLVTVQYSPDRAQAMRDSVPALYRRQQQETVRWDLPTWRREHVYSTSLIAAHHATHTRGEDWLVLSGISGGTARVEGKIELVDLRSGVSWLYKVNTTSATAVLIPEARQALLLQSYGASRIKYLDQSDDVSWAPPR